MKLILDKLHNDHINFIKLLTFLEWLKWTMIEAQSRRDGNFKDCGKVCCVHTSSIDGHEQSKCKRHSKVGGQSEM